MLYWARECIRLKGVYEILIHMCVEGITIDI